MFGDGFLGGLGASLGGAAVGSAFQLAFPGKQSGMTSQDAFDANLWATTDRIPMDRPRNQVRGLRNAGINPILAFNGQGLAGSAGASGAANLASPDRAQREQSGAAEKMAMAATAKMLAEAENIKQKTSESEAEEKFTETKQTHELDKQFETIARTDFLKEQEKHEYQKKLKTMQEKNVAVANEKVLKKRLDYLDTSMKQITAQTNLTNKQTEKLKHELVDIALQAEISASEYGRILRYMERAYPAVDRISAILGGIVTLSNLKKARETIRFDKWGEYTGGSITK